MKRVFQLLDVYILGDRLHTPKTIEIIYKERQERELSLEQFESNTTVFEIQTTRFKDTQKIANAGPNAPLLKRIVKNPQALQVGSFVKSDIPKFTLEKREAIRFPTTIQDELKVDRKIRKIRPMDEHFYPESPTIPSVDEWLQSKKNRLG